MGDDDAGEAGEVSDVLAQDGRVGLAGDEPHGGMVHDPSYGRVVVASSAAVVNTKL